MLLRNVRAMVTVVRNAVLVLAALLATYGVAGLIGGSIPANGDWQPPAAGVELWVETNGVHTGIVVPKVAAGIDWRGLFPPRDLADPRFGGHDHLSIGWGEQHFFLETPTWWDVRPATVLAAAIGSGETLLHVEHVARPTAGGDARRIVLTVDQYRRLAAFIRASLVEGGARHRGYAGYDAFYQARGRYDAVRTCNEWTGAALRSVGVRVGRWTPFAMTVMGWFR